MPRYLEILRDVSPTRPATDVLGAVAAVTRVPPGAMPMTRPGAKPGVPAGGGAHKGDHGGHGSSMLPHFSAKEAGIVIGSAVGGGALGAFVWKRHRWLGAANGMAVGTAASRFALHGMEGLPSAAADLATSGVATFASLKWKRHPFLGWLLGGAVAGVPLEILASKLGTKKTGGR